MGGATRVYRTVLGIMTVSPNQSLESNRRPATLQRLRWELRRAVHAHRCVSGGGRSAFR